MSAVAATPSTDDRLLDATGEVLAATGWAQVTMADVAATAGVSRQTLYKRFGSRAELAQAYALREAGRLVAAVETAITANAGSPRAAIAAAFDVFLAASEQSPLVQAIVGDRDGRSGDDELLGLVTTRGRPVLETAARHLASVIAASWPSLPAADGERVAEIAVRLAISTAAQPDGPAGLTGEVLAEVLTPYVEERLVR